MNHNHQEHTMYAATEIELIARHHREELQRDRARSGRRVTRRTP